MYEQATLERERISYEEMDDSQTLPTEKIVGGILVGKAFTPEEIRQQLEDMPYMG